MFSVTYGDVVKQFEGGGATAGGGGNAVRVFSHSATLPITAAVLSRYHHQALFVLQIHRPPHTIPVNNMAVVRGSLTYSVILFNLLYAL